MFYLSIMVKSAVVSLSSPSGVVKTVAFVIGSISRAKTGDDGTWLTILKTTAKYIYT